MLTPGRVDFYTWIRDAALTMKEIVDAFVDGQTSYEAIINDYITSQAILQTVTNPSGLFFSGAGLGEPKFQVDEKAFNAPWGRPQRDGPALRAITLMAYISWLLNTGNGTDATKAINVVWPVVLNDLSYVGQYWNQTGFDLWEEVEGSSFFTLQLQHRALSEGAATASALASQSGREITCPSCESQAPEILCFLQSFWNGAHIVSNINANNGRTGLDANSLLGSIHDFDNDASCNDLTFQPCNSKSLANFKAVVDSFRPIYGINQGIAANEGVAIGRYAEDVYYGGNPWILCTLAAAEFLYDVTTQLKVRQVVTIDNTSLPFYKDIYPAAKVGIIQPDNHDSTFQQLMQNITAYADSFVAIVQRYTPANGTLFEQFDRSAGAPLSAIDLTWSYASFVSMSSRRAGVYPPSWGASKVSPPPSTCAGTSAVGTYVPAVAAGAPNITFVCTSSVRFDVNASTYFGENLYVIGDIEALGDWNPSIAAPMSAGGYTAQRPLWTLTKDLPASANVSYKYLRQESDGSFIYESINRTLTSNACGSSPLVLGDAWSGPT